MATVAPGEGTKICEQGCLSECYRVEAASVPDPFG